MNETVFLGLAAIVVLGVAAQWLAWRLGVPSILLLLASGFLAGPVSGLLDPDALFGELLFPGVTLAVALILFEGGLTLSLRELKGSAFAVWNLVTLGAVVTWAIGSWLAYVVLGFPVRLALLLGAILVVTGPTVVLPLLRHIQPVGRVAAIAKWEGIVVDPIGAVLAVLVYEAERAMLGAELGAAAQEIALELAKTLGTGAAVGALAALATVQVLRRYWIPDFLQNPALLGAVICAFAGSNLLREESGLLTVTVMGVVLANQRAVPVAHILEFKENLRVLLISTLFILLGARVDAAEFAVIGWRGLVFVLGLVVIARPVSVFLATLGLGLSWKERAFLAWLAPRGIVAAAVASVFELRLGEAGHGLVPATFLVIIGTVAIYGLTATRVADWLGLSNHNPQGLVFASAHAGARAIAHAVSKAGFPVVLIDNNHHNIRKARMEGLTTHYTSILSRHALETVEGGGLGRLLAMTPDDQVNALAALHFREAFGRANVFQLSPPAAGPRAESAPAHLRGRLLFDPGATYGALDERFSRGAIVKSTRLSQEFDFKAFRKRYGESALPLFLIEEDQLMVCSADVKLAPKPGQTLVALVDTLAESASPATPEASAPTAPASARRG